MGRLAAGERRDLLRSAALRVLSREGLGALTTRAVVAEAGMKLASFHYAYSSRTDLLRDMVAGVVAGERGSALPSLVPVAGDGSCSDPVEVIQACLRSYLRLVAADPGREQGMFELTQHALRDPALDGLAREQYARYHALGEELLTLLADELHLHWRAPVADLARLVVSLTDGLTLAWLADRDDAASERATRLAAEALAAHAVVLEVAR